MYVNDLSEGLSTNVQLFVADKCLFSVIHDRQTSANDLNKDLEMMENWAFQSKMILNLDPTQQVQEVIFICKKGTSFLLSV